MKKLLCTLAVLPLAMAFTCSSSKDDSKEQKEGYRPVYADREAIENIYVDNAKGLENPGKIYVYGNMIFVNEVGKGIHVIDNSDPSAPQNIAFMSIPGNMDLAIKDNILYANNSTDIVAIDVSDPYNVQVVSRVKDAFPMSTYPDETGVVFECVDESKGIVVGWEKALLTDPKCSR